MSDKTGELDGAVVLPHYLGTEELAGTLAQQLTAAEAVAFVIALDHHMQEWDVTGPLALHFDRLRKEEPEEWASYCADLPEER